MTSLTPLTSLRWDIGIEGDDADEVLLAFIKAFNVQPGNFRLDRHFGGEGFNFLPWVLWKKPSDSGAMYPLTIQDLCAAAETGVLEYDYATRQPESVDSKEWRISMFILGQ